MLQVFCHLFSELIVFIALLIKYIMCSAYPLQKAFTVSMYQKFKVYSIEIMKLLKVKEALNTLFLMYLNGLFVTQCHRGNIPPKIFLFLEIVMH